MIEKEVTLDMFSISEEEYDESYGKHGDYTWLNFCLKKRDKENKSNETSALPIWIDGRQYEPDCQAGSLRMLKPVIEKKWWEFWK